MKFVKYFLGLVLLLSYSQVNSQVVTIEELDILHAYRHSDPQFGDNMPELHDNDLNTYATWKVGNVNNPDWGIIELYYSFFVITEIQLYPKYLGYPHSWDFNIYIRRQFESGDGTLVYTNDQYLQPQEWISIPVDDVPGYEVIFKGSDNTPVNGTDIGFYEIKVLGRYKVDDIITKIFLEGPYENGNMGEGRTYIPTSQPFFSKYGYNGTEVIQDPNPSTFITNHKVIDWVLLEIYRGTPPDNLSLFSSRAALLTSDGDVIETNGTSAVEIKVFGDQSYYLVIRQMNHLDVMSSEKIYLPGH